MAKLTGQQLISKAGKLHAAGKFGQAEKIYQQLLKANPNDLTIIRVLGMLERDRRNLKGAIHWFTLAKQVSGNAPIILAELALTLEQAGNVDRAMEIATEAIQSAPVDISIAIFYAKMCLTRGLASKAAIALENSIDSDPNNAEAWHLLSMAANNSGTLPVPLQFAQKLIQLQPQEAQSHTTLATAHRLNGHLAKALASYETALAKDKHFNEAIAGKAEVLESLGRTEEAIEFLDNSPPSDSVLVALAKVRIARKQNKPEVALEAIDAAFTPSLSPYHQSNLRMHRGRVLEELERYDEAWSEWEKGNQLHAGNFPLKEHIKLVDTVIQSVWSDTPVLGTSTTGAGVPEPIFIVGMFRSGTTLLEQIIGAHPEIDTAGEVNQILRFVNEKPYPTCINNPDSTWQQQYLDRLASDSKFCTDKMPMNYLHIGLIHLLFPNAKIIHTTRNPLDTCVSCFANSFSANHSYTADVVDLLGVYEQYKRVMEHWNTTFPGLIYEVPYETIVSDFKNTIQGTLQYIGVDFDERCIEFYNTKQVALTPSADQVRKPIYDSSVGRHKRFGPHLGILTHLQ
jgi:tetratricopeptide (TPR) repeat protein